MRRSSRVNVMPNSRRSYWIPGSYTPTESEKHSPFLRPLENKVFQESGVTTIELYDLGTSTALESNKSLACLSTAMPVDGQYQVAISIFRTLPFLGDMRI
jgi:hypothetical protein